MALKADTQAQISFKDLGQHDYAKGEGLGFFVNVAYKRTSNDVTYTLRTTDTTYQRLRALNGASLIVSKPFGALTAKGLLELGPRKSVAAELIGKWKFEAGRDVELKGLWSERTGATTLTVTGRPHRQAKLRSTINSKTQAIVSDAELGFKGFTISPAVKWQSGEKGVGLSHKLRDSTVKASYALDRQVAGVEVKYKLFKVSLAGPVGSEKRGRPTLTIGFEKNDYHLSSLKDRVPGRSKKAGHGDAGVPDVQRHIPIDTKLKELDAVYEPRLQKAEAKARRSAH